MQMVYILKDLRRNSVKKTCNCEESNDCPLQGNCLARSIVYEARVTTEDDGKVMNYIGMTANDFKGRYRNHQKSFRDVNYSNETELSKYICTLKHSGRSFSTSWAILKRAKPYAAGGNIIDAISAIMRNSP